MESESMTKQEIEEWNELYEYVKRSVLGYTDKNLPKNLVLRLKGLSQGKFMANKRTKPLAHYTYKQISTTFKLYKFEIINGFKNNERVFQNEGHKFNYMMVIIENKINDVVDKMNRVEKAKIQGSKVEVNVDDGKAIYKKKTKEIKNDRLNGLW